MIVEVCANGLESALIAERAGADRIELCSELGVGGITPSYGTITAVREKLSIPIHVLIRPRSGHFIYSSSELEVMLRDIAFCKEIGVDGIVSGVLSNADVIALNLTQELIAQSGNMHFTFHRAFDWVSKPLEALAQLQTLGVDTVLTSGGQTSAENGLKNLSSWQLKSELTLMPGGGINTTNIQKFKEAGLKAVHLSGTTFGKPLNIAGKIPMNSIKHLLENNVAVTNLETIRQIVKAVK